MTKLRKTNILYGESDKAIPYTLFINNDKVGRAVLLLKTKGKWKGYHLLHNVIIYKKFRKRGLCNVLINLICTKSKNIYLIVRKDNVPAIRCYQKSGFKKVQETNVYYTLSTNPKM